MEQTHWRDEVARWRREKDEFFRGPKSPLQPHERAGFRGLPYWPPDPRYRCEAKLDPSSGERIRIPRSGGDEVLYERVGTFTLYLPEAPVRLAALREADDKGQELFLAFKDSTSGTETYDGGRYLEAKPLLMGRYVVDFNYAYHPFCVHNGAYTCPLPPRENWLRVPLRAGERLGPA